MPESSERRKTSQRGWLSASPVLRPLDEPGDLGRIERFAVCQRRVRIAADAAQLLAQSLADDCRSQRFVRQAVPFEEMLVEEVAERPVAHVVQQARHPQQRLDIAAAGGVGARLLQAGIESLGGPAGQVHDPDHVRKPRVLGRGIDPPGGLQLVNVPQPLHPRIVDDLPLGDLARRESSARRERDVAVDRVVGEVGGVERHGDCEIYDFRLADLNQHSGALACF